MTTPTPPLRDSSAARAWLVDYVATCYRDANLLTRDGNPDKAQALRGVASDLTQMLRHWHHQH